MMTWSEMIFAIVITAFAGSLLQDALLPNFLRQAKIPMKTKPEMTDPSILAMVLDDMESLDLIKLSPNAEKRPLTEDQHMSEKAAVLIPGAARKAIKTHRAADRRRTDRLIDQRPSYSARRARSL
jgi:hypothetical protein